MPNDSFEPEQARHTAAHLLAAAVKDLYSGAHNAIGPAIEDGFYQDFDMGEHSVSEADFPKIEKRMKALLKNWGPFEEKTISAEEARKMFADNPYKLELLEEFAQEGKDITVNDPGPPAGGFLDLCKGGHSHDPKTDLKHFKLTKVSGAYWRGDDSKPMLTRIYGVVFPTQEELDEHLNMLEEAKARDHKKLGKELKLFTFSNLVGPGLPLFTPRGTVIKDELEQFVREEKEKRGYQFAFIPHLARAALYERSGHLGKYDAMMPVMQDADGDQFVVKPMNCPHHFELYKSDLRSYRDLPLRLAGTTEVYRNEKSGELQGLVRVAAITQDDTHHFVRHDQIASEIEMILDLMKTVYDTFDFSDYEVHISVRNPATPDAYFGDDELWSKAEAILEDATKKWGVPYTVDEGEAAFYGPKIDVTVKDVLGRRWQLTTVQLDFNQPENFDLTYTAEDGSRQRPAILHVAILGAVERFMGILIEHYAGALPLWLSPVQVAVLPIGGDHADYANEVATALTEVGVRVEVDARDLTVGKKIREAETMKTPVILVVGDKEVADTSVAVRSRALPDVNDTTLPLDTLLPQLTAAISSRQ